MDVWINFKYATKWQAEGIFKCFFPSVEDTAAAAAESLKTAEEKGEVPAPKRKTYASIPLLCAKDLEVLAKQFAEAIPENELSVSSDYKLVIHLSAYSRFRSLDCKDTY
jgi:chaperone BCS1